MTSVEDALRTLGLTRLAHFTPAKTVPHILRNGLIRSSKDLAKNAREYFHPTDIARYDRHPDKVCCSFEFPNGYYLAQARAKPQFTNYPDWVCLLLDAQLCVLPGTLFSPCNAATGSGAYLRAGGDALLACYADTVQPGNWSRRPSHHPRAATDLQAEVLVPGPIRLAHLLSIAVPSNDAARNETARVKLLGLDPKTVSWVVAPRLFDRDGLSSRLRFGGDIEEHAWNGEEP